MRFFILLFLLGTACAKPVYDALDNEAEVARDILADLELTPNLKAYLTLAAEGDDEDPQTELGKKLKETFDQLLEKIKDTIDHGKTVKEETLEKLKEVREKLKELKIEVGNKAKELLEKIKDKAKDFLKNLLEKLGLKDDSDKQKRADEEPQTELGKKLRDALDELLVKLKDAIDHGKTVKEDTLEKIKQIREQLKELKIDIGERAKELLEKVKEKVKDYWKRILEKLGLETSEKQKRDDEEPVTEEGKKLKESFDLLLEKIKDAIDHGRNVKKETLEKLKEIRQKLKDLKVDLGNKARELLEKIKEKVKNILKELLEKLGIKDDSDKQKRADEEPETEMGKKLREGLDQVLEKIKEAIENGKTVKEDVLLKFKEIREKMKEHKIDFGNKARELLEKIKEKATDFWKNLLDKLGHKDSDKQKREEEDLDGTKWQERLDEVLVKIKDAVDNGKFVKLEYVDEVKKCLLELKRMGIEVSEKAKELWQEIIGKAKGLIKHIMDQIPFKGENKRAIESLRKLFQKFKDLILSKIDKEALIEKVHSIFGKGSELADQLVELLKKKGEEGKKKILDFIDRVLVEKEEVREERSIAELWEKVKNYFKDLKIEITEKYLKFGEWVKNTFREKVDSAKSKIDNIKEIAKELHKHVKDVSKDVAVEALEFLRPYKEDLGSLWDQVKDSVKEIMNRKD